MQQQQGSNRWCILRTAPSRTLALAASLSEVGFEVWAPVEHRERLAGPKSRRQRVEQAIAIMPGYVFARETHISDLRNLSRSPSLTYRVWDAGQGRMVSKGHPYFSIFNARSQSDASLAPLRALEADLLAIAERRRDRARMRQLERGPAPKFEAGQTVSVGGGAFEGLHVTVAEANAGKTVMLTHPDWIRPVEISAWKLQAIQLNSSASALAA